MTEPAPDLSAEADDQVQPTDNGWHEGDPADQPSQDPAWVPEGSATEAGR